MKASVKNQSESIEQKKVVEFKLQSKKKMVENKLEQTFETTPKPAPFISMDSKQIFNRIYQNNLKVSYINCIIFFCVPEIFKINVSNRFLTTK